MFGLQWMAAEIASQDAYYPFGKRMPNLSSENANGKARYEYNGKELDDEHGLNWLAYGARYFDPELGAGTLLIRLNNFGVHILIV
jgi:hypothetical protein